VFFGFLIPPPTVEGHHMLPPPFPPPWLFSPPDQPEYLFRLICVFPLSFLGQGPLPPSLVFCFLKLFSGLSQGARFFYFGAWSSLEVSCSFFPRKRFLSMVSFLWPSLPPFLRRVEFLFPPKHASSRAPFPRDICFLHIVAIFPPLFFIYCSCPLLSLPISKRFNATMPTYVQFDLFLFTSPFSAVHLLNCRFALRKPH